MFARRGSNHEAGRTSLLHIGLPINTRCVNLGRLPSGSMSASSARRLPSSCSVVRLGMTSRRLGAIETMRFRARRSVFSRGERGKLCSWVMSLSVKSMASWSYTCSSVVLFCSSHIALDIRIFAAGWYKQGSRQAYLRNSQVLNGGYLMAYRLGQSARTSQLTQSVVSVLFHIPRRSSSRSRRGLR